MTLTKYPTPYPTKPKRLDKSILSYLLWNFKEVFHVERKNTWMERQIIELLRISTDREIQNIWCFVSHLVPAHDRMAGEPLE